VECQRMLKKRAEPAQVAATHRAALFRIGAPERQVLGRAATRKMAPNSGWRGLNGYRQKARAGARGAGWGVVSGSFPHDKKSNLKQGSVRLRSENISGAKGAKSNRLSH